MWLIFFRTFIKLTYLIYFNLTLILLYLEPKVPRLFSKLLHINLFLYQNLTQRTYFTTKGYSEITFLHCLKQVGHGLCRGQAFTENTKLLESEDLKGKLCFLIFVFPHLFLSAVAPALLGSYPMPQFLSTKENKILIQIENQHLKHPGGQKLVQMKEGGSVNSKTEIWVQYLVC